MSNHTHCNPSLSTVKCVLLWVLTNQRLVESRVNQSEISIVLYQPIRGEYYNVSLLYLWCVRVWLLVSTNHSAPAPTTDSWLRLSDTTNCLQLSLTHKLNTSVPSSIFPHLCRNIFLFSHWKGFLFSNSSDQNLSCDVPSLCAQNLSTF